jgi:hypothetical protein
MPFDKAPGARFNIAAVDPAKRMPIFPPQKNIFGDRKMGRQQRFLMHHRNARRRGLGWIAKPDRLPSESHLARIGSDHAGDDFHQRRLARAVLAHQ